MTRKLWPAVALLLFFTTGCGPQEPDAASGSAKDESAKKPELSVGERFQRANNEVTELLIEADRRQIDTREFRSRHTGITVASVKNFESATIEMEKLAADLRKALGR